MWECLAVDYMTISRLKAESGEQPRSAKFDAQLQAHQLKQTRTGKPYLELTFVDATGQMTMKAWNNHPQYNHLEAMVPGTFTRAEGEWTKNQYGMDAKTWTLRPLNEGEKADFLAGDPATKKRQDEDWAFISEVMKALKEPRLKALAAAFVDQFSDRFRRAAAARKNHHARRGGLVEHTAQMMRGARGLCTAYPDLNEDLMLTGILFHDCGKMWENCYKEDSFAQDVDLRGELLGHINIGMEIVNKLWRQLLDGPESRSWIELEVPSEHVRLHLLHLIASHHGQYEFGSPVLPKTPEAHALHHIDNFDAKYEMLRGAYESGSLLAPGIYDRVFPLPSNAVDPLPAADMNEAPAPEIPDGTTSGFLF